MYLNRVLMSEANETKGLSFLSIGTRVFYPFILIAKVPQNRALGLLNLILRKIPVFHRIKTLNIDRI